MVLMLPDKDFVFTVNEQAKMRLERHLDVLPHVIVTDRTRQEKTYGEILPHQNIITLFLGSDLLAMSGLLHANRHVINTLLHEYRHAWQFLNWTHERWDKDDLLPYWEQEKERDARDWAESHIGQWLSLGRLTTRKTGQPKSRFARMEIRAGKVRAS